MGQSDRTPILELAGYEDLKEIGRGGSALVYRAHQPGLDRTVALKVIDRISRDDDTLRRFRQECRAMGSLSWHPNVVVVYEAGTSTNGVPYIAMEYLPGGSLGARVRQHGALPWREAAKYGTQVADALAAAHASGVLHRDVKPENILIDRHGNAKLADFGIAAIDGGSHTASGVVTASVAHAAPEVLAGRRSTEAADVYSLGSTLFALLAGRAAFVEHTDESYIPILLRATTQSPPPLSAYGVPDSIAGVVMKAMTKAPEERDLSAGQFAQALRDALGDDAPPKPSSNGIADDVTILDRGEPTRATPTSGTHVADSALTAPIEPARRPHPWRRRSAATLVVVVAAAVGTIVYANRGGSRRGPAIAAVQSVPLAGHPRVLTVAGGALWASLDSNQVARVPLPAGAPGSSVDGKVDKFPVNGQPAVITASGANVFVGANNRVSVIDTRQASPSRAPRESPPLDAAVKGIAAQGAKLWVTVVNQDDTVHEVVALDANTLAPVGTPLTTIDSPGPIAFGAGSLWVGSTGKKDEVSVVDPVREVVTRRVILGKPSAIKIVGNAVWVSNEGKVGDQIARIDARTYAVTKIPVGVRSIDIAADATSAWVTRPGDHTVVHVDATTNRADASFAHLPARPWGIVLVGNRVWIASIDGDRLTELAFQAPR